MRKYTLGNKDESKNQSCEQIEDLKKQQQGHEKSHCCCAKSNPLGFDINKYGILYFNSLFKILMNGIFIKKFGMAGVVVFYYFIGSFRYYIWKTPEKVDGVANFDKKWHVFCHQNDQMTDDQRVFNI